MHSTLRLNTSPVLLKYLKNKKLAKAMTSIRYVRKFISCLRVNIFEQHISSKNILDHQINVKHFAA